MQLSLIYNSPPRLHPAVRRNLHRAVRGRGVKLDHYQEFAFPYFQNKSLSQRLVDEEQEVLQLLAKLERDHQEKAARFARGHAGMKSISLLPALGLLPISCGLVRSRVALVEPDPILIGLVHQKRGWDHQNNYRRQSDRRHRHGSASQFKKFEEDFKKQGLCIPPCAVAKPPPCRAEAFPFSHIWVVESALYLTKAGDLTQPVFAQIDLFLVFAGWALSMLHVVHEHIG